MAIRVLGMEVRVTVIVVVHRDHDSEEGAYARHRIWSLSSILVINETKRISSAPGRAR